MARIIYSISTLILIQRLKKYIQFADDAFMNFSPNMTTYHLPDSGGSYLSRFQNDTPHIVLTIALEAIVPYQSIYLTVILLDFMAYASYHISKIIHCLHETVDKVRYTFKNVDLCDEDPSIAGQKFVCVSFKGC